MKKYLLIGLILVVAGGTASAQMYQKHFGVRMGATTGFTAKVIKNESFALEGMIGIRNGGVQVYGFLESYKRAFQGRIDNMWLYFGPGFHFGFANYYSYGTQNYYHSAPYYYYQMTSVIGFDGVLGLEYQFPMSPVALGIDFKPTVEMIGLHFVRVNFWDIGVHVRFNL